MTEDPVEPTEEDSPLVCFCMIVDEATIRRAIDAGAHSVEELQNATYACTGCGTCRYDLMRLLDDRAQPPRRSLQ